MKNIKAMIFDLGGVIYNINYQKTIKFMAIGLDKKYINTPNINLKYLIN